MATPPTVTQAPPRQEQRPIDTLETSLRMTYEEFLAWADEDVHAEWEDGEVIVFMPPKDRHQDLVRFLAVLLDLFVQFFRLGQIRFAPFEMKVTPDSPAREPDIFFVAREHQDRLTADRLVGPADLIVEIASDDSVLDIGYCPLSRESPSTQYPISNIQYPISVPPLSIPTCSCLLAPPGS